MSIPRKSPARAATLLAGTVALMLSACGGTSASAPTITTQPADQAVVMGSTATFSVVATGSAPLSYQWSRNGTAIAGATSASYTTPATSLADTGTHYAVTVSNGAAPDATSATATLTVNPPPGTFEASATTISAGEGVILTYLFGSSESATLQEGTGTPVPVTSGGVTVVYPTETTTYTLAWTTGGHTWPIARTVTVKTYTPKHLYVVNGGSNTLSHFTVDMAGLGGPVSQRVGAGVATGTDPVHVASTPDEKFLYVANQGGNSISAYALNATTGAATPVAGSPFALPSDAAPFASVVSHSGKFLYVGCAGSIQVFAIGASGALTAAPSLKVTVTNRTKGDVLLHPSGNFLFVADAGNAVVKTYSVDAATGALAFVADAPSAGGPVGMTFDRAATHLVTRGSSTDPANNAAFNVFAVNPYTGVLASTTHFEGFGEIALWAPVAMANVRGADNGHHALAFGRQPGIDVLYDAYTGEVDQGTSLSAYWLDAGTGTFPSVNWEVGRGPVPYDPGTTAATPIYVDFWGSAGDSVFTDRGGQVLVLTSAFQNGQLAVWPVTPDGILVGGMIGDYHVDSGEPGDLPAHGVFTGTLQ